MAGLARKRARDGVESATTPARASGRRRATGVNLKRPTTSYERKRAAMEADEIESDMDSDEEVARRGVDVDGGPEAFEATNGADNAGDISDRDDETAEQKRLRLARAYLTKVGLDPDVDGSRGDNEGAGGDENADAIAQLQDDARKASGRMISEIAGRLRSHCSNKSLETSRSVRAHDIAATCVALCTDGERAASGGKDSRVILWDVETGRRILDSRPNNSDPNLRKEPSLAPGHVGHVLSVAVADDQGGNIFASGGTDRLVRIWDARVGKQVDALRGHRGSVNALAFREGSMQLFSGSADRTVKIWNIDDMAYVETLFGHGAEICAVDSFAKERALSCGRDGTMRLYKVLDGSQLVFRRSMTSSLDAVTMVNEQRFLSGGDDGAVSLWHVNKKRPVSTIQNAHGSGTGADAWISSVAAGRNTDLAATGAGDGFVRLWECADRPPSLKPVTSISTGAGFVNGLAFGDQCLVLVAAMGQEHRLGRWERQRGVKSGVRFIKLPEL